MSSPYKSIQVNAEMVQRMKQKYESLSHSVLVEVATVQEESILNLKKVTEELKEQQGVVTSQAKTAKQQYQDMLQGVQQIEQMMMTRMKKIETHLVSLSKKVNEAESAVGVVEKKLITQQRSYQRAESSLRSEIMELEEALLGKEQKTEIGIQCDMPQNSLRWEEEMDTGLPSLIDNGQPLIEALDHPVIKHLFECWVSATTCKPSRSGLGHGDGTATEVEPGDDDACLDEQTSSADGDSQDKMESNREEEGGFTSYFSLRRSTPKPQPSTRSLASQQNDIEAFLLGRTQHLEGGESIGDETLKPLITFVRKVLDVKRERSFYNSTHVLEVNHLPKEIWDGFYYHLYPILRQRESLKVRVFKRVRKVHDIKFTVTHLTSPSRLGSDLPEELARATSQRTDEGGGLADELAAERPSAVSRAKQLCRRCRDAALVGTSGEPAENPWGTLERLRVFQYCSSCALILQQEENRHQQFQRSGGHVKVQTLAQSRGGHESAAVGGVEETRDGSGADMAKAEGSELLDSATAPEVVLADLKDPDTSTIMSRRQKLLGREHSSAVAFTVEPNSNETDLPARRPATTSAIDLKRESNTGQVPKTTTHANRYGGKVVKRNKPRKAVFD